MTVIHHPHPQKNKEKKKIYSVDVFERNNEKISTENVSKSYLPSNKVIRVTSQGNH